VAAFRGYRTTIRTFRLGLMGILAVGVSIGAIRLALPFADLFRSELEDRLAEALGMEVQVGRLELGLAGLVPRLWLRDAVFLDPENGRPRLSLAQLRIDLDPVASLGALTPRVASVTLVGARLAVRRLPTGAIVVTGLEGLTGDDPAALGFFLGHGRFRLVDNELSWIDEQLGAPPLQLSEVRLDFENRGERHRIGILARYLDDRRSRLRSADTRRNASAQAARGPRAGLRADGQGASGSGHRDPVGQAAPGLPANHRRARLARPGDPRNPGPGDPAHWARRQPALHRS